MLSVSPIKEKEIEQALRPFMGEDFKAHQRGVCAVFTGTPGGSFQFVELKQPEAKGLLCDLQENESDERNKNAGGLAALQFDFTGSMSMSFLYSQSSRPTAVKMEYASATAALTTLKEFAAHFGESAERGYLGVLLDRDGIGCSKSASKAPCAEPLAFVVFFSVAAYDQTPSLQTTAFLLNTWRDEGRLLRNLVEGGELTRLKGPLREAHAGALDYCLSKAIGNFERQPQIDELRIVGVPQAVAQKLCSGRSLANDQSMALTKQELFDKWHAQGEALGWGPNEASALLRSIERRDLWREAYANPFATAKNVVQKVMSFPKRGREEKDVGNAKHDESNDQEQDNSHSH